MSKDGDEKQPTKRVQICAERRMQYPGSKKKRILREWSTQLNAANMSNKGFL